MSITATTAVRLHQITTVRVTSDLAGTVYYHWYLDGVHVASGTVPEHTFCLDAGDQARVEVIDTTDADYDAVAGAPAGYPARKTLWWIRSLDAGVRHYRIDQQADGGDWDELATIPVEGEQWDYYYLTPRLDDLTSYAFRIVPLDAAGNAGTALELEAETVVRRPDAPEYAVTFDEGTTKVVFSDAA